MLQQTRIHLSSPHLSGLEQSFVADAFATNWIAPLGPHVDEFEREFAAMAGARHAVALSSGTAALHLALQLAGVGRHDEVMVSTFTFAASVNPVVYLGATPVLIDSERTSWNMDPELLAAALSDRARRGSLPKAVVVVHIYGQSADLDPIQAVCQSYGVPLVEDAAEALGATYRGRMPGTIGLCGAYSFNGNKIITTSGGGMLVTHDDVLAARARKLATQARDLAPHYEHSEIGYNYRLSNVCAAIGRGQLPALEDRVAARRRNFDRYVEALQDLPGIGFMPEASWGRHTRWNSVVTLDQDACGMGPEQLRLLLADRNIESRPVWKPMHRQPVFAGCESIGGSVADDLFARGLVLPSGSNLTSSDLERVIDVARSAMTRSRYPSGAASSRLASGAA
ncbi:MAG TPA: aminotransferase class I/II-fold pyridoxal phosphate-dependent enzyme [Vicinamibacterales bacterium]|nr:aminotransferase class I/II-fold pyridoxal phosphate-dependent enzyme [Vicinamibacterales bacterium]